MSEVHAQARTTPRTRAEIKESKATLVELAERYNISKATARKWKNRESPEDLSHRPHKLNTTLTPAQEAIAVELRCMALLPLDDLVAVVREFINPDVSRAGLDRCLRRHGVGNLRELQAKALADAGETKPALKTFKEQQAAKAEESLKGLPQAKAAVRAKPIALTALAAMIGGFFILDDPIFQGLATSLLFGLASSTLLTVLVIPAIYVVMRDDGLPLSAPKPQSNAPVIESVR